MSSVRTDERKATASADDLAQFHRTLSEMCRSETPFPRALRLLAGDLRRGPLRRATEALADDVASGEPFAEAYARHGDAFPPLYAALVTAGCESGDLTGALAEIARHAALAADVRGRIRKALSYPFTAAVVVFLLAVAAVVVTGPTTWGFSEAVAGPLEVGPFSFGAGAICIGAALGVLVAFGGAALFVTARTGIPILGRLRTDADRALVASLLAGLVDRRVPLPAAIGLAAGAAQGRALRVRMRDAARRAENGDGLADALSDAEVLPPSLAWLVACAEERSESAEGLADVAEICRDRLDRSIDRLVVIVRPVAELIVGVAVFLFALGFLIPILDYAEHGLFGG